MKAKIRKTGEIVEIISYNSSTDRNYVSDYVSYIDSNGVKHNKELLNYYWDFEPIEDKNIDESHWQDVRERAAIAALQGILANSGLVRSVGTIPLNMAIADYTKTAVGYADELIKELRNEKN